MLIPISDDNTGRLLTPAVVYLLIAINIAVFLLQLSGGDQFTLAYAAVPYKITHNVTVVPPGVQGVQPPVSRERRSQFRQPVERGVPQEEGPSPIYLTLLTSMFMHGGWMHILGNMWFLWIFGDNVEDNFGHFNFVVFYLICGLVAALAQIMVDPNSVVPSLGASGAIAGVLAAYLVLLPGNRVRVLVPLFPFFFTTFQMPAIFVIGFWIVLQFINQYATMEAARHTVQAQGGGVAYMAHIGGFLAGLVLVFLFRRKRSRSIF